MAMLEKVLVFFGIVAILGIAKVTEQGRIMTVISKKQTFLIIVITAQNGHTNIYKTANIIQLAFSLELDLFLNLRKSL